MKTPSIAFGLLFAGVSGACAAEPLTYLRCTYAEPIPADPTRVAYISIDPEHQLISFSERGSQLNDITNYRMTDMNDSTVKGSNIDKDGDETRLEIDRLSGRAILYVDKTRIENLGRQDKLRERVWSSMSLNCQVTKPVI